MIIATYLLVNETWYAMHANHATESFHFQSKLVCNLNRITLIYLQQVQTRQWLFAPLFLQSDDAYSEPIFVQYDEFQTKQTLVKVNSFLVNQLQLYLSFRHTFMFVYVYKVSFSVMSPIWWTSINAWWLSCTMTLTRINYVYLYYFMLSQISSHIRNRTRNPRKLRSAGSQLSPPASSWKLRLMVAFVKALCIFMNSIRHLHV